MGLIKAAAGALGGGLADQWREYFYCDSLDAEILVAKGEKRVSGRSSNKKGDENIISNGSVIAVNEGQCMIIVEQGKIVDVCAEPGEFTYDSSTEPSIFYGSLGENIKKSFAQFGRRFTFGGDTAKDQRVYFVNTKEITGNKFGTPSPIPFRVIVDENLGYKLSVDLRCSGIYSYKIVDPVLFYTNVCANVTDVYERSNIEDNLRGELLNALQPALANISAQKIMYYEIPAHTKEVSEALETELAAQWRGERGIEIFTLSFNTVSIPEDQRKKLTEWEENAMTTNSNTAAARLVGGQVEAMKAAASNTGGMGAMGGFFGMNMAQNAGGASAAELFQMGQNQNAQNSQGAQNSAEQGWTCSCGHGSNVGKFCTDCGAPKPQTASGWTCSCGAENTGKFCQNCGKPKPQAAVYKCDKCGWQPDDPTNPPKFCPQCGDRFDDNDNCN